MSKTIKSTEMKYLIILIIIPHLIFSQTETKTKLNREKTFTEKAIATNYAERVKPEYYLNNKIVDFEKIYLNANNIESVNVVKKGNGQIFIKLKENIVLENLSKLKYENINTLQNKIFIIDNKILKKPTEIKIDKTEIGKTEIISSSEFENQNLKFTIIKITTKSELKRIENNKKIILRGKQITAKN